MGMAREPYFTVQQIYRGWALFGIAIFGWILANAAVAWTYPANQATQNWTVAPPDWADLRTQWEHSHAANAVMTFAALCCAVLAQLAARE